ncbi:TetR/AcrR family transcriptional regulator [Streptomyces sp. NBC_00237]|uniref:TetR/AcrR family transcriptional regulator n=1 Tax=Streptomyces sp. NBC_00237 TaxID=2975687 RepID=UPI0022567683|nr:TetR/AcrR family transcriptional regulator [Streptomyces sp. NBC_00237]MCX5205680.1 TetR/AcrR family transcriptional regulator [Streptomyces sp. NBC_00237]
MRTATLALLEEVGYARLRMDDVAARAGVGKAALYRRWPSKAALTLTHLVHDLAPRPTRDTGSLRGDLRLIARGTVERMTHPRVRPVLPELMAELLRTPELRQVFETACLVPEREQVLAVAVRAVTRGELTGVPDVDWAHAQLIGPVFAWLHLLGREADDVAADRLADDLAATWTARAGAPDTPDVPRTPRAEGLL